MPYNDDAREPSSVTGRALGAVALIGGLGAGGMIAHKSIKKGLKKFDNFASEKNIYAAAGDFLTGGSQKVKPVPTEATNKSVSEEIEKNLQTPDMPTLQTSPKKRNIKTRSVG